MWLADAFEIFWPPSVLIFFLLVIIFYMLFSYAKSISTLTNQVAELTIQISLLKHENKKLKRLENCTEEEEKNEYINM